jgi:hypothetical protein
VLPGNRSSPYTLARTGCHRTSGSPSTASSSRTLVMIISVAIRREACRRVVIERRSTIAQIQKLVR